MKSPHSSMKWFGSWHCILKILKPKRKVWSTACVNYRWGAVEALGYWRNHYLIGLNRPDSIKALSLHMGDSFILLNSSLLGSNRPKEWTWTVIKGRGMRRGWRFHFGITVDTVGSSGLDGSFISCANACFWIRKQCVCRSRWCHALSVLADLRTSAPCSLGFVSAKILS